jgi:glycosyltransferase involved in cell wall biosynthesis
MAFMSIASPPTRFGRSRMGGRLIDYASYYAGMRRCASSLAREGDVLIAKTDPPLTSLVAMRIARRTKALLVNWLQDVYPETAAELGVPFMRGAPGRALGRLRDLSLHQAQANVVVGERMAERLRSRRVPADTIHLIPNWCDDEWLHPLRQEANRSRQAWGLEHSFVVEYAGNLGRAHEFQTMLAAAERLRNHPRIVFLFIGGGHGWNELARAVKERGLSAMFRFVDYQPQERLNEALNVADVHLISLKPELEGLIVPSKFYGIAAVGRAMIMIGARNGEIGRLVEQHDCGLTIEPGDGAGLAESLMRLVADPPRAAEMGKRARAMLDQRFSRQRALARWQSVLSALANPLEVSTCALP